MRAQFVLSEIWIGLRRNLTMTIAVIVTVAVSLALFGSGLLIRKQVDSMKNFWYDKIQVSVFLCVESSTDPHCKGRVPNPQQKQALQRDLSNMTEVNKVYYESQDDAWKRFQERFANNKAFVEASSKKDMPDSFRVQLKDPKDYDVVASAVEGREGVDSVANERQVLERFFSMLNGLRDAAFLVALIQVIAAALLIGNTIRLAAYSRRRETGIMRLVGASNFYIQLPFLLEGAIAGLIGGVIASGLIIGAKQFLFDNLQSYFNFTMTLSWGAVAEVIVFSITVGVLLCSLASFLTLRRYLRV